MSISWRPAATRDIDGIWNHTEETWGRDQAERYIRQLERTAGILERNPQMGSVRDELRTGIYSFSAGSHTMFYHVTESGIDVVRVLHQRMDLPARLDELF